MHLCTSQYSDKIKDYGGFTVCAHTLILTVQQKQKTFAELFLSL